MGLFLNDDRWWQVENPEGHVGTGNSLAEVRLMLKTMSDDDNGQERAIMPPPALETIFPSAKNRSKPSDCLIYNRVPKCGSTTAMKVMRRLSRSLQYKWIDSKVTSHFVPALGTPKSVN